MAADSVTILSNTDYYPFGMELLRRKLDSEDYRFGFNGMEKDDEVKGSGNSLDFGARIYDPRLGKWLSTDPLQIKYSGMSPYHFAANSPIYFVDPDGKENLTYLAILLDARAKLAEAGIDIKDVENQANKILSSYLGVETQIKVYEGTEPFKSEHMDPSDTYIALGENSQELLQEAKQGNMYNLNTVALGLKNTNPEKGEQGSRKYPGNSAAVIVSGAQYMADKGMDSDVVDALATLMVHGMIHNSLPAETIGVDDNGHLNGTIMAEGTEYALAIMGFIKNGTTIISNAGSNYEPTKVLEDFWCDDDNCTIKSAIENTRGTKKPVDNYEKNKAKKAAK